MALHDLTPQLRTRLGRVERLVGVFLMLTLLLMVGTFAYFLRHTAQERGWGLTRIPYYTFVSDATGLKVGTPVMMMGFNIGEVTKVDQMAMEPWYMTNNYNVFVGFEVREPNDGYIWTDSRVRVGSGDFLVSRSLEVTRGNSGLLTVKRGKGQPTMLLSDAFLYEPSLTNRNYIPLDKAGNGYWLGAEESAPLQQRLTEIANTINAALPGILGMTNQLAASLSHLTQVTAALENTMPKIDGLVVDARQTLGDFRGTLGDVRPLLQAPGGIGNLLVPTNLNTQLTLTLSNLNPGAGPIGMTLSNLNLRMADVGVALSNVNQQLSANTNLLADANQLTRDVGSLAVTLETLFKRHWLFRSAYKTNRAESGSAGMRRIGSPKDPNQN